MQQQRFDRMARRRMNEPDESGPSAARSSILEGSRARQHRVEPGESSVSANHASAARSVRAAAQARPPMRVLGGGSVDPAAATITSPTPSSRRKPGCRWSCSSGGRAARSRCTARTSRRRPWATSRRCARTGDEPCLGYAFYAPPRAVPRARRFPTGPVSADAVLAHLARRRIRPRQRGAVTAA